MPEKYQDYLAANVLNQGAIISYRSLSRALKVHSNEAKEMLYEFHHSQNARTPSSVHATYLLAGSRKPQSQSLSNGAHHPADGEDSLMSDTSFMMSSSMPAQDGDDDFETISVTSITLVPEEHLVETKSTFENITSIHIYSLEPGPLSNIRILSDCNRKISVDYASEDPLESWKQYGTIHNPNAKRRTTRRPPPPPAAAQPQVPSLAPASKAPDASKPSTAKAPPKPKRESSDIFKSFSKSKTNGDQQPRAGTHSDAPGSLVASKPEPPTAEDESMKDIPDIGSDGDDEGDDEPEAVPTHATAEAKEKADANRKARLEREANLRQMMDQDDDDDDDEAEDAESGNDADGDAHMAEADAEADAVSQEDAAAAPQQPPEEQQAHVTVSDGRRRGRRRVMKKKTTRDAEGYLVTKEEAVWESFSEDEPASAAKAKPAAASAAAAAGAGAGAAKGKKPAGGAAGKAGQGNIMNFFGKK